MEVTHTLEDRIKAIVEEVLTDPRLFVVEVVVRGVRGSRVVEVYIDGDEPVGVDRLAELSREIGFLLDTGDVIDGRYRLQVSSPGLDRPLASPRQFPKQVGRRLRVKVDDGADGAKTVEGELLTATDEAIELGLPGGGSLHLTYDKIRDARVVLPW